MVVGRDEAALQQRFGIANEWAGTCYTRTGRRFFEDDAHEAQFIARVRGALSTTGIWDELDD